MNTLVLCTAVLFSAQAVAADPAAPPTAGQTGQTQATPVATTSANAPVAPAPSHRAPAYANRTASQPDYPVGNVRPGRGSTTTRTMTIGRPITAGKPKSLSIALR